MNITLLIVLVLGATGLLFGLVLALADKKFAVEVNPLVHQVEDVLPKGQCGACGYAGCAAYAEAVVTNPDVAPNLCAPGKEAVAKAVAALTGKTAAPVEPRVARVLCGGGHEETTMAYQYSGVADCHAANLLFGGPKACKHGCLGLGTCARNCPFQAITMGEDGLPDIDPGKCTGCGKCATVCPKTVITLVPLGATVTVACHSPDKGADVRKKCRMGCIGCGLCAKNCPSQAITVENNLARIDYQRCTGCGICVAKCPTKAIHFVTAAEGAAVRPAAAAGCGCGC